MDDKVPEIDIKITTHKVTGKVRKLRPGFRGSKRHILEQLVDGVWVPYAFPRDYPGDKEPTNEQS